MVELAQNDYPTREEITRQRLMDACAVACEQHGIGGVRIKNIVEISTISRRTVYNYFNNIEALVMATFVREGERIARACTEATAREGSIEERFVKGFVFVYENLPKNPVLRELINNNQDFFSYVDDESYSLKEFGEMCFQDVLDVNPEFEEKLSELTEYWSRAVLSLLILPGKGFKNMNEVETYVRTRFLPGLGLNNLNIEP